MTYAEKRKDPRWRALKTKLLKERGFVCADCGATPRFARELEPHHKYYDSVREPWEYPDDVFKLLCRDCHQHTTEALKSILYCLGNFTGDQIVELEIALTQAIIETGSADSIHSWMLACLSDPKHAQLSFTTRDKEGTFQTE